MSASLYKLLDAINNKKARIGILDSEHSRLTLAHSFGLVGFPVLICNISYTRADKVGLQTYCSQTKEFNTAIEVTKDPNRLGEPEVLIVQVQTPITSAHGPDFTIVSNFVRAITPKLRAGQLVTVLGIIPPGTTRAIVLPLLSESKLEIGRDYLLAYISASEDEYNNLSELAIGGFDHRSREAACALFSTVFPTVNHVSTLEVAELCSMFKIFNRTIKSAFVNEFKIICNRMGVDAWEVFSTYKSSDLNEFAMDLDSRDTLTDLFISELRRYGASARLIQLAYQLNAAMPRFILEKVIEALNQQGKPLRGSQILIMGIADLKNMDDPSNSPAFELMDLLLQKGALVRYNDPSLAKIPRIRDWPDLNMTSARVTRGFLASQDCVLFVTDHPTCDFKFIVTHSTLVIDARNATRNVTDHRTKIIRV